MNKKRQENKQPGGDCIFQVTYINQNGNKRTTEVTASNKVNAACKVARLGKVLTVQVLR